MQVILSSKKTVCLCIQETVVMTPAHNSRKGPHGPSIHDCSADALQLMKHRMRTETSSDSRKQICTSGCFQCVWVQTRWVNSSQTHAVACTAKHLKTFHKEPVSSFGAYDEFASMLTPSVRLRTVCVRPSAQSDSRGAVFSLAPTMMYL